VGGAINNLSPYVCTALELCQRFGTTAARKQILEGFLDLRAALTALGVRGFHWLDGSFVEDIEAQEGRDPGDSRVTGPTTTYVLLDARAAETPDAESLPAKSGDPE